MLTMAIPDVEISAVRWFPIWFQFIRQLVQTSMVQEVGSLQV